MPGNREPTAYDVIVVGAGMAGHCAALEAARQGGSVLLLEKTAHFGGSTAMCGGAFAFAGTEVQMRQGIQDTADLLEEDLMNAGKHRNDRALVHVYAQRQYETYQWLQALGLKFEKVSLSGAQSIPRNHSIDPSQLLETLHRNATEAGVTYRPNAGVARLLAQPDGNTHCVLGVVLASGEELRCRGGVILATGGFSRSAELVERFVPHLRAARPMGGYGNTGDGLRMAWALGADLIDMGYVKGSFGACATEPLGSREEEVPRLISAMYRGAIVVNRLGKRFINESVSYKLIGDRCLEQPDALAFQIFDQAVMNQSSPLPTVANYRGALEAGLLRRADSIEGLAGQLGVDAAELLRTVQRYNAACDGQVEDEFSRTSLSTGYGRPARIDCAPFYGYACTTGLTSTYCGLHTDALARVLTVFNEPIAGLYASGEVTGGFHGETYMSGSSLVKGCIFGRIAAQDAVTRARPAAGR